jgi:hypothetical protein
MRGAPAVIGALRVLRCASFLVLALSCATGGTAKHLKWFMILEGDR